MPAAIMVTVLVTPLLSAQPFFAAQLRLAAGGSGMSHELRTPLNGVLGFAQLMQSETPPPSPSQQRSIQQNLKGGWYLLRLIDEILDLAMIESGKVTISPEPMSLAEVLQDCRVLIGPQAKKREIELIFPAFDELCYIRADLTRVKQVRRCLEILLPARRPGTTSKMTAITAPPAAWCRPPVRGRCAARAG